MAGLGSNENKKIAERNVNSGGECRRKKVAGTMGRCSKALGGTITLINAMESNAATMILLHLEKYTF